MSFTLLLSLLLIVGIFTIFAISDKSKNLRFSKAIALTESFIQKVFVRAHTSSNQKVITVKASFFTKLKAKLTNPETIISVLFTVLFGMASRYFILTYCDVDVFKEFINWIAIGHFTVLAMVKTIIQLLLEHLEVNKLIFSMNSGNAAGTGQLPQASNAGTGQLPQASNTGTGQSAQGNNPVASQPAQTGNPVAGQPAQAANPVAAQPVRAANYWGDPDQPPAGVRTGPIDVHDPQGQLARGYIRNGINQPVLDNIGSALEDQFLKGGCRPLSRAMFTREQERFILAHLDHTNHQTWFRIMGIWGYQGGPPRWRNVKNTAEFRSNFWRD